MMTSWKFPSLGFHVFTLGAHQEIFAAKSSSPLSQSTYLLPSKVLMKSNTLGLSFLLPEQIWCWAAVIDRSRQEMLPLLWEMAPQWKARAGKTAELFTHCKFTTFKPFSWATNKITVQPKNKTKKDYDKWGVGGGGGSCNDAILRINVLGLPGCKWESFHLSVSWGRRLP